MRSLCIAVLALSAFARPAPDVPAPSELLHVVTIEDPSNIIQQRSPDRRRDRPRTETDPSIFHQGSIPKEKLGPRNVPDNVQRRGIAGTYESDVTTGDAVADPIIPPSLDQSPSPVTGADGPLNFPKSQPQPAYPRTGWQNSAAWPNKNANRPHPANTIAPHAPELIWNHEKGTLELEGLKTVPPAAYAPAPNSAQVMPPAQAPYYPPVPPPAQQQPKLPTGWDVPIVLGGPDMAGMNHDMPKPDFAPAPNSAQVMPPAQAPYYPPVPPPAQQQPKLPTGWDVPIVLGGPDMAGMNHDMPKPDFAPKATAAPQVSPAVAQQQQEQNPKSPTGWDIPIVLGGPDMAGMNHDMPKPDSAPMATAASQNLPVVAQQQQQSKSKGKEGSDEGWR